MLPTERTSGLLAGKVALVVGAGRGIGAATALAFARAGARVVLASRNVAALEDVAAHLHADGGWALIVPTDVTRPAEVERLIAETRATFGRLDCAFNNAAAGPVPAPLADIPLDGFDLAVQVNLRGVFLAMRAEIPLLIEPGSARTRQPLSPAPPSPSTAADSPVAPRTAPEKTTLPA